MTKQMKMLAGKYPYTLVRCRRRTYSIKIDDDNSIVVRAPLGISDRELEGLLSARLGWIERVLAANASNTLATENIKNYAEAYVCGRAVPVLKSSRNYIDGEGVHVCGPSGFRSAYVNSLGGRFMQKFREIERLTGLRSASVSFRAMKSMWGRCDGECGIAFNYKLMMLPESLQTYVMVHELCHTVHHDHSAAFWALVASFLPDWKGRRALLKKYGFLARMY